MMTVETTKSMARRLVLGALLAAAAGGFLGACSSLPPGADLYPGRAAG